MKKKQILKKLQIGVLSPQKKLHTYVRASNRWVLCALLQRDTARGRKRKKHALRQASTTAIVTVAAATTSNSVGKRVGDVLEDVAAQALEAAVAHDDGRLAFFVCGCGSVLLRAEMVALAAGGQSADGF